jgi:hypothetical protein
LADEGIDAGCCKTRSNRLPRTEHTSTLSARLRPHRVRTFRLSTNPAFASKRREVVDLYVDPPAHSLVLLVDEKSQIQALDCTGGRHVWDVAV